MTRERDDIVSALCKKGFRRDDGDHIYLIYWNISGKKTMKKTKMSHGSSHKTISHPLLAEMSRQVGLSKKQFLELIDCSLDQKGYEEKAFPNS